MFLHKGLKWYDEENPINEYTCLRNIGNATKESTITFEFGKSDVHYEDLKFLPFQVHIHYTRIDGAKCIRVMSKKQEITENRQVAEENLNVGVIGLHSVQQTAKIAEEGNYTKARLKTFSNQKLVKRALKKKKQVTDDDNRQYVSWMNEAEKLDKIIKKTKEKEEEDGLDYFSDEDDDKGYTETINNNNDDEMEEEKIEEKKQKYEKKSLRTKERRNLRTRDDDFSNVMYQQQKTFGSKFK